MTAPEKILFKKSLKQAALNILQQRIDTAKRSMAEAQQAANQEEKSSAGDKYETSRAMGHLQKDMHALQMAGQMKELAALHAVNADRLYDTATAGALLQCQGTGFFLSAGLGKHTIRGQLILYLSPQAPLARLLTGKKTGDSFSFGGKETVILDIF